jgi:hypothetical protein
MNDYVNLTTYKKDYVEKPIKRVAQNHPKQEFADPVAVGHKQYLFLHKGDLVRPNEDGEEYLERYNEEHRGMKKAALFDRPLDPDLIVRHKVTKELATEYQANYCDVEKDIAAYKEGRREAFRLPDDAEVPLTTHTATYKHPLMYTPRAMDRPIIVIPPTNIGDNEKINEILGVKTEISEYADHIGSLGELIVKAQMEKHLRQKKC